MHRQSIDNRDFHDIVNAFGNVLNNNHPKMYIFISFHIVNHYHTKSAIFSSKNQHDYI